MSEFLLGVPTAYTYIVLLFGLILGGGFVFMPALYLASLGVISFTALFIANIIGAIISDSFWYFVGKYVTKEKIYSLPLVRTRTEEAKRFSTFYDRHGIWMVFFAKFVYGTRIASQILAGMHKNHYPVFLAAITLGTAIWTLLLFALITIINLGLEGTRDAALKIQLSFLILIVIVIFLNWITRKYVMRTWTTSNSSSSAKDEDGGH